MKYLTLDNLCFSNFLSKFSKKEPKIWLEEINSWNIYLNVMDFYLLPQANNLPNSSGLVTIFKNQENINKVLFTDPYNLIENKLYIPVKI